MTKNGVAEGLTGEREILRQLGAAIDSRAAEVLWRVAADILGISRPVASAADSRRILQWIIDLCGAARTESRMALVDLVVRNALGDDLPIRLG